MSRPTSKGVGGRASLCFLEFLHIGLLLPVSKGLYLCTVCLLTCLLAVSPHYLQTISIQDLESKAISLSSSTARSEILDKS